MTASLSEGGAGARAFRVPAILAGRYRHVYMVDDRNWFAPLRGEYQADRDLVLTYDFGLRNEIRLSGGTSYYLDHLISAPVMQENNYLLYQFFRDWHRDAEGRDTFEHRGVSFGFAFRIDFWNDLVSYVRAELCLDAVLQVGWDRLLVGTDLGLVESILADRQVPFTAVGRPVRHAHPSYSFPIHRWLAENRRHLGWKSGMINLLGATVGSARAVWDRISGAQRKLPGVLANEYHPTATVIQKLRDDGLVRVISPAPSRRDPLGRVIPSWRPLAGRDGEAREMLQASRAGRAARLVLTNGRDVSKGAYAAIERCVAPRVAPCMKSVDAVLSYLDDNRLALHILISNLGDSAIIQCTCASRGVPSYLVANGLLSSDFVDDGRYATRINAYSPSMKRLYFRDEANVVCLGDPRMDAYPPMPRKLAPSGRITIGIGASGHNPTDLNSYFAVEFEFLHDVLTAIRAVQRTGIGVDVILKVRANGYRWQYEAFVREYFANLSCRVTDDMPIPALVDAADLFVTIYSQTLFEASCKGVPVVYYQSDDEIKHPPFDGASELVTEQTVEGLTSAILDCLDGSARFDAFLDRDVMAKYVGPLDGGNMARNVQFIYDMVGVGGAK